MSVFRLGFVAALAAGVMALAPPTVGPTVGYKPLTVNFDAGFVSNVSGEVLDVRYRVNSLANYVGCVGALDNSIGSASGTWLLWTFSAWLWHYLTGHPRFSAPRNPRVPTVLRPAREDLLHL